MQYVKLTELSASEVPLRESDIQKILVDDPELLGLGDLYVQDIERRQPKAGRLDMLLIDPESSTRYEVELQLGSTDETHIIRTIEYWDNERRRYPQHEHVAVIVAENITSRFFNVINLFNGFIPLVAIKMTVAQTTPGEYALVFTKVLDHATLGTPEDDNTQTVNREFWARKSSQNIMDTVETFGQLIRDQDPTSELSYTTAYVGIKQKGFPNNYLHMYPRKTFLNVFFRVPEHEETEDLILTSGIRVADQLRYRNQQAYRVILDKPSSVREHQELLTYLLQQAREERQPQTPG